MDIINYKIETRIHLTKVYQLLYTSIYVNKKKRWIKRVKFTLILFINTTVFSIMPFAFSNKDRSTYSNYYIEKLFQKVQPIIDTYGSVQINDANENVNTGMLAIYYIILFISENGNKYRTRLETLSSDKNGLSKCLFIFPP